MTKSYLVAGANWIAELDIATEHLTDDDIKMEVATRAVEAHFGKRSDVLYKKHTKIKLSGKQKKAETLHTALIELLTEELEKGCGIGMLLCIMDKKDPKTYKKGEEHEWYISSKPILENVGVPALVQRFNEKYPDQKDK